MEKHGLLKLKGQRATKKINRQVWDKQTVPATINFQAPTRGPDLRRDDGTS